MNSSEDEPLSGLNVRLRPRRRTISPHSKSTKKAEGRIAQDKLKRTSTPSRALKPEDLTLKPDSLPAPHFLCSYCDRKFASKQTVSKHARRIHLSISKQDFFIACLFCNHTEAEACDIIRHMVDSHPNQYFACLQCQTRFSSTSDLAEHKLNVCERQKPYRSKLRQKTSSASKKTQKNLNIARKDDFLSDKEYIESHGFNGIVISCELKPSRVHDGADIEDNITTNLILPPSKPLDNSTVIEKNAVIVLDDIQWNKRIPPNFSFHNTDADQILSRLGVVHRSPRTGESTRRDWFKTVDEPAQKFEKCFETSFYSKVASNVAENLAKFLDGSFNFNPDLENTIKTRKAKNSVVINTAEGFPILLACQQYSRNMFDSYLPRSIAPKHKWKWDSPESDKSLMNADQIKRDSHTNNCIISLVSSLDIWTQLSMRKKFENKFNISHVEKKTEKQNRIDKELKDILESRDIPKSSTQLMQLADRPPPVRDGLDFPSYLGLAPSAPTYNLQPAVLSGEWVRPRCYVCCACGAQTRDSRALSNHISMEHPNAQVQHYEIVGEPLLNADILKHLYVPPTPVSNRTRPLRGIRDCTKCKKSITLKDLHQHMLDCAGDTPAVRRKCRYRPFGVRRRRPRLPDNVIRRKIRKDIRNRHKQNNHLRPRQKIRSEVGDAETIRKMIADLPAKRHRVMINPMNPSLRPRRKLDIQRSKLMIKHRSTEDCISRKLRSIKDRNVAKNSVNMPPNTLEENINLPSQDDEDNKPLKPTRRSTDNKKTRHSDTIKRKTVLNRAKRKIQMKNISHVKLPDLDTVPAKSNSTNDELLNRNIPKKINVNNSQYTSRQHTGRGGSYNRGGSNRGNNSHGNCDRASNDQGNKDQGNNDQGNNNRDTNNQENHNRGNYNRENGQGARDNNNGDDKGNPEGEPPDKNDPLGHSKVNGKTDKSLQSQSTVLQDCKTTTHYSPTRQAELFENEAADSRLDKPPLPCNQKVSINPQKRKRLNDCIAMLKHKLVDPPTGNDTNDTEASDTIDNPATSSVAEATAHDGSALEANASSRPDANTAAHAAQETARHAYQLNMLPPAHPTVEQNVGRISQPSVQPNRRRIAQPDAVPTVQTDDRAVPYATDKTDCNLNVEPDTCPVGQSDPRPIASTDAQQNIHTDSSEALHPGAGQPINKDNNVTAHVDDRLPVDTNNRLPADANNRPAIYVEDRAAVHTDARSGVDTEAYSAVHTEARSAVHAEADSAVPTAARSAVNTEAHVAVHTEAHSTIHKDAYSAVYKQAHSAVHKEAHSAVHTESLTTSQATDQPKAQPDSRPHPLIQSEVRPDSHLIAHPIKNLTANPAKHSAEQPIVKPTIQPSEHFGLPTSHPGMHPSVHGVEHSVHLGLHSSHAMAVAAAHLASHQAHPPVHPTAYPAIPPEYQQLAQMAALTHQAQIAAQFRSEGILNPNPPFFLPDPKPAEVFSRSILPRLGYNYTLPHNLTLDQVPHGLPLCTENQPAPSKESSVNKGKQKKTAVTPSNGNGQSKKPPVKRKPTRQKANAPPPTLPHNLYGLSAHEMISQPSLGNTPLPPLHQFHEQYPNVMVSPDSDKKKKRKQSTTNIGTDAHQMNNTDLCNEPKSPPIRTEYHRAFNMSGGQLIVENKPYQQPVSTAPSTSMEQQSISVQRSAVDHRTDQINIAERMAEMTSNAEQRPEQSSYQDSRLAEYRSHTGRRLPDTLMQTEQQQMLYDQRPLRDPNSYAEPTFSDCRNYPEQSAFSGQRAHHDQRSYPRLQKAHSDQNTYSESRPHSDQQIPYQDHDQRSYPDSSLSERSLEHMAYPEAMYPDQRLYSGQKALTDQSYKVPEQALYPESITYKDQQLLNEQMLPPEQRPLTKRRSSKEKNTFSERGVPNEHWPSYERRPSTDDLSMQEQNIFKEQNGMNQLRSDDQSTSVEQTPIERRPSAELQRCTERRVSGEHQLSIDRRLSFERQLSVDRQLSLDHQLSSERKASLDRRQSCETSASFERESSCERGASFERTPSCERGSSFERMPIREQSLEQSHSNLSRLSNDRRLSSDQYSTNDMFCKENTPSSEQGYFREQGHFREQWPAFKQQLLHDQRLEKEQTMMKNQRFLDDRRSLSERISAAQKPIIDQELMIQNNALLNENETLMGQQTYSDLDPHSETYIDNHMSSNMYHESTSKPPTIHSDHGLSHKAQDEVYMENDYRDIPSDIPLAHASTNVLHVTTSTHDEVAPLDLSGRMIPQKSSRNLSQYDRHFLMRNYETYGTLDLSNTNDGVVDLRVKSSTQSAFQSSNTSNTTSIRRHLSASMDDSDNTPDLARKPSQEDFVPNNLPVRRISRNELPEKDVESVAYDVHKLSGRMIAVREPKDFINDLDLPTDLSGRPYKNTTTSDFLDVPERKNFCVSIDLTRDDESLVDILSTEDIKIQYDYSMDVKTKLVPIPEYASSETNMLKSDENIASSLDPNVSEAETISTNLELYTATTTQTEMQFSATEPSPLPATLLMATSSLNSLDAAIKSLPVYTLPNRLMATTANKHESTVPVYSLGNACISVTKIESSNSATLTNTLLSIAGTTIANTTSVYTLAGTTIGAPLNYGIIQNNGSQLGPVLGNSHIQNTASKDTTDKNVKIDPVTKVVNKVDASTATTETPDPETARKIAMLPKEIVEVLGALPAENRNQLLNVLPQFVSTSISSEHCESNASEVMYTSERHEASTSKQLVHENQNMSDIHSFMPNYCLPTNIQHDTAQFLRSFNMDKNPMSYLPANYRAPPPPPPPPPPLLQFTLLPPPPPPPPIHVAPPPPPPLENDVPVPVVPQRSIRPPHHPPLSTQSTFVPPLPPNSPPPLFPPLPAMIKPDDSTDEDVKPVMTIKMKEEKDLENENNIDKIQAGPSFAPDKNTNSVSTNKKNKIIDLTEEENPPANQELTEDLSKPAINPPQEKTNCGVDNKVKILSSSPKLKIINDKTASLRAVRIKTPSERNKSSTENRNQSRPNIEPEVPFVARPAIDKEVSKVAQNDHEIEKLRQSPEQTEKQPVENTIVEIGSIIDEVQYYEGEDDKLLEWKISLAIQQAEISSTQQNNKNKSNLSNLPATGSPVGSKPGTDDLTNSTLQKPVAPTKEIVTKKDDLIDNPLIKLRSITSLQQNNHVLDRSLNSTSSQNYAQINAAQLPSQDNTDPKTSDKTESCTANAIEERLSTEQMTVTDKKCAAPVKLDNLFDDESDDDVSLAVIVKNRDQLKNNLQIANLSENKSAYQVAHDEKIQEDIVFKETTNNVNKDITSQSSVYINDINETKQETLSSEVKVKEILHDDNAHVEEFSLNEVDRPIPADLSNINNIRKSNGEPINQNLQETIQNKDVIKQDVQIARVTKIVDKTIDEDTSNNTDHQIKKPPAINETPDEETSSLKNVVNEINKSTLVSLKPNNKDMLQAQMDRQKKQSKYNLSTTSINNDNLSLTNTEVGKKAISSKKVSRKLDEIQNLPETNITIPHAPQDTNSCTKESSSVDVTDHLKPNTDNNIKKLLVIENNEETLEIKISNNSDRCSEIDEYKSTLLRRSRRGKSNMDSVFIEDEIIDELETSPEQKIPLTKKQLIFSKLLLDEEIHTGPQAHSTPVKDSGIVQENIQTNHSNLMPRPTTPISEVAKEQTPIRDLGKRKRSKRKKSVQLSKKKKSYENSNTPEIEHSQKIKKKSKIRLNSQSSVNSDQTQHHSHTINEYKKQLDVTENKFQLSQSANKHLEVTTDNLTSRCGLTTTNEKLITSGEKRKLEDPAIDDCGLIRKTKKLKFVDKSEPDLDEKCDINILNTQTNKEKVSLPLEKRTACYMPAAARRTRSKSVIVKSSTADFYDPYDIDLDDMIEKPAAFRSKNVSEKNSQQSMSQNHCKSKNNNKHETLSKSPPLVKKTLKPASYLVNYKRKVAACSKNNVTDSDDSTKSDVPLNKYIEEKEKKILHSRKTVSKKRKLNTAVRRNEKQTVKGKNGNKSKDQIKNRRSLATFNEVDKSSPPNDAEELRSEKFMESFGFFSQRKPRKSNLLASKKISETFHIIANESDDAYFGSKKRTQKKSTGGGDTRPKRLVASKRINKRVPKTKKTVFVQPVPCFCRLCKKEFRRSDNFLRHQMTVLHASKLSEIELKLRTIPIVEKPNYLIAYKRQLDRLRLLTKKFANRKNSKFKKIKLPSLDKILAKVNKKVREMQLAQRGLSRDEALFIDCCQLLQSNKNEAKPPEPAAFNTVANIFSESTVKEFDLLEKPIKGDGDVDSITAKNILESDEVKNLEKDLISGLKEAANASSFKSKIMYQRSVSDVGLNQIDDEQMENSSSKVEEPKFENVEHEHVPHEHELVQDEHEDVQHEHEEVPHKHEQVQHEHEELHHKHEQHDDIQNEQPYTVPNSGKTKKQPEVKDKMYPDVIIESIDMFEDKFDKIKRKCRSQAAAAAAKQTQVTVEPSASAKCRKKSEKKKARRNSKKSHQSSQVPTKGALKGFDGIKVSIPTSDINMAAIAPPTTSPKKKKKGRSKNKSKKERFSGTSNKHDNQRNSGDGTTSQKEVDVYEFMDNEEAVFEFRPSTLMERFKSINYKDTPGTSKVNPGDNDADNSSDSVSDGDDFVYMSDDYVCSDDETENSLLSCEFSNGKVGEGKKHFSPLKRKDAVEKNAVMGKIFKHNAVRSDKKSLKIRETTKPKANLDQLFDSLLEEDLSSSMLNNETESPKNDVFLTPKKHDLSSKYDKYNSSISSRDEYSSPTKVKSPSPKLQVSSPKEYDTSSIVNYGASTSKAAMDYGPSTSKTTMDFGPSTSKMRDIISPRDFKELSPSKYDSPLIKKHEVSQKYTSVKYREPSPTKSDVIPSKKRDSKKGKLPSNKLDEGISTSYDYNADAYDQYDDMGVARQRARRKCTVGKQNVLAETWSSESEPDGIPPRPNSAESVVLTSARKKKAKKREGHQAGARRANNRHISFKKHDIDSKYTGGRTTASGSDAGASRGRRDSADAATVAFNPYDSPTPSTSTAHLLLGPPGPKPRPRTTAYYNWSSGDDEPEHVQQHGWIVGDSHKKLVTMLAHAKGRKRNNDDKRHFVE